jgi:hypothetical protein
MAAGMPEALDAMVLVLLPSLYPWGVFFAKADAIIPCANEEADCPGILSILAHSLITSSILLLWICNGFALSPSKLYTM